MLCDERLTVTSCCENTAYWLGHSRHNLVGRRLADLFHLPGPHLLSRPFPLLLSQVGTVNGTRTADLEIHRHGADDRPVFLVILHRPAPVPPADVVAGLTSLSDNGIFHLDAHGVVRWGNEALARLLCLDPGTTVESFNLLALINDTASDETVKALFRPDGPNKARTLVKRTDDTTFWAEISIQALPDGAGFYGIMRDVSTQVSYETQLQEANDALTHASEQLDTFLYHASHDLRSPMTSIEGLIHLRELETGDRDPYLERIKDCLERFNTLVRKLTSISKATHRRVADERIDFHQVLESTFGELRKHPRFNEVEKKYEMAVDTPFFSDLFRVSLILKRILENVYDFADDTKKTSTVLVTVVTSPEKAIIEVTDNGKGIARSHVSHVFRMFYRADSEARGSGIGLYVAHQAVKVLRGTITLQSEYGLGTTVRIELPNSDKARLMALKTLRRNAAGQSPDPSVILRRDF